MFDVSTLRRDKDGSFRANDKQKGVVVIDQRFPDDEWDCPEAFQFAGIKGYDPMTAKELDTDEAQDKAFNNKDYIVEEKFDGTRALVYFLGQKTVDSETNEFNGEVGYCRVFSRRISKKTNFYVENTDSLPHIREIDHYDFAGTILDGEMFIDGLPFKEVASTLNCLWDKAIDRQIEKGFITFHAFDILFYRGIDMRKFPLHRRKYYLSVVCEGINSPYIKMVDYYKCGEHLLSAKGERVSVFSLIAQRLFAGYEDDYRDQLAESKSLYPNLYNTVFEHGAMTPRAFYELIVSTGGEGAMLKPIDGKYYHKRGWEYSKVKKFLTRELIVLGFDEPTREYTGKEVKKWAFWVNKTTGKRMTGNFYGDTNYEPVTKFYFYKQVGNLLLGVFIPVDTYWSLPVNKRGEVIDPDSIGLSNYETNNVLMQVCECSGFDDEQRKWFTDHQSDVIGSVVEVKANEVFKDSGKLRHPRFMRTRFDKSAEECTWENHI